MSRERFVDPHFFQSESVNRLSIGARLTLVGLIVMSDDHGRGHGSPTAVKFTLYPAGDISVERVNEWLREIEREGIARFYPGTENSNGNPQPVIYYDLPNWSKYQGLRYISKSKIPPHPETCLNQTDPGRFSAMEGSDGSDGSDGRVEKGESPSSSKRKGFAKTLLPSTPAPTKKGFSNPQKKREITPEDLRSNEQLNRLFWGAAKKGLVKCSDADRLKYFSAAEHALEVAGEGAGNLFASIVTEGNWKVLTDADDDRARKRLKEMRDEG